MDKEDLYGGVLLNCKKEKTLSSVKTWVDLEGVPPGEINQTRKGKYIISLLTIFLTAHICNSLIL